MQIAKEIAQDIYAWLRSPIGTYRMNDWSYIVVLAFVCIVFPFFLVGLMSIIFHG